VSNGLFHCETAAVKTFLQKVGGGWQADSPSREVLTGCFPEVLDLKRSANRSSIGMASRLARAGFQ
jgi:hypothetical protein